MLKEIQNTWFEKLYCCHADKIVIAMLNESNTSQQVTLRRTAVQNL